MVGKILLWLCNFLLVRTLRLVEAYLKLLKQIVFQFRRVAESNYYYYERKDNFTNRCFSFHVDMGDVIILILFSYYLVYHFHECRYLFYILVRCQNTVLRLGFATSKINVDDRLKTFVKSYSTLLRLFLADGSLYNTKLNFVTQIRTCSFNNNN